MNSNLDEPIWDGNGGTLDPKKAPQRDLLVALHIKVDNVILPLLRDHEERIRVQENGDLTRGQRAAVLELMQKDKDETAERRNLKLPVWAVLISFTALLSSIVLTIAVGVPHVR